VCICVCCVYLCVSTLLELSLSVGMYGKVCMCMCVCVKEALGEVKNKFNPRLDKGKTTEMTTAYGRRTLHSVELA